MVSRYPHQDGDYAAFEDYEENGKKIGKKLKPRALNIVWGKDDRYWNVPEQDDDKPAELLQVCWLEVTGSAEIDDPQKDYEVIFNISLTIDAFGWGDSPVYVMVKKGKDGSFASKKYQLTNSGDLKDFEISCRSMKAHVENQDSKNENPKDKKLYFGLYEVWSGKWKGGLKIHNVIVKELPGESNTQNSS